MSNNIKPLKISDLPELANAALTDNDLFMVSDADDPKSNLKYQSKSLRFKILKEKILAAVKDQTDKQIKASTGKSGVVHKAIEDEIKSSATSGQIKNSISATIDDSLKEGGSISNVINNKVEQTVLSAFDMGGAFEEKEI